MSKKASALVPRRWLRFMPIIFITYSFASVDRSNYSIAAPGGLERDLGMTPALTGLAAGLFFVGYFFFQVPAAGYAERKSVRKLLFWSILSWGLLSSAQGLISQPWLLIVDRLLLGAAEAAVAPALLVLVLNWFHARERARADTFSMLGGLIATVGMSVVSGYLVTLVGWRWMLIIEGAPALVWAFVFRALVVDRPSEATWLSEPEKRSIETALREDEEMPAKPTGYRHAFLSPTIILLTIQYLVWNFGLYGFLFWLPTVLKEATAHGLGEVGVLAAVPYAVAAVVLLCVSYLSDRLPRRRGLFIWPLLIVGGVTLYASSVTHHFWLAFVLLIVAEAAMQGPQGAFFASIPTYVPRDVAGGAMGLINSFGGLGGFIGAYIVGWFIGRTGTSGAFTFMAGSVLVAAILAFVVERLRRPASTPLAAQVPQQQIS
ncbi:MFS transporter [Amycolatopsis sacchari]|uniref:MFS transporter n=1 Tax=Amycolatopsis dongchuanensis TaxID=1070866 RepID=A0ABP8VNJ6_9PSEU